MWPKSDPLANPVTAGNGTNEALGPERLRDWLQAAAEALAVRLRVGAAPRGVRREGRALLVEAFQAVEGDTASLELVRRVDALATPPGPRLGPRPRIGAYRPLSVVDLQMVATALAAEALADRAERRVERFLAVLEGPALPVKQRKVVDAAAPDLDFAVTEG